MLRTKRLHIYKRTHSSFALCFNFQWFCQGI